MPSTETQEWNQPTIRCAIDPMVEAMQLTEPVEESRDSMGPLVQVEEHQVDNATDMEGDDVRIKEVEAEWQLMITQTDLGQKQRPSKQEGTRKVGGVYESGGEGMGSEYSPSEKVTLTTTPPSSPQVNIYAPSGSEKLQEREDFFNLELLYLLIDTPTTLIMGGNYNCVLAKTDVTGHFNFSRALNTLISGYDLVDMWAPATGRGVYTHYARSGAERLDRKYVSRQLSEQKYGIETAVAAFTDHLAAILCFVLDVTTVQRGRSYWKMDAVLLRDAGVQKIIQQRWRKWKRQRKLYPHIVIWWERMAKKQLRKLLIT